eukprot:c17514_g1_i1.p1 GENE.c17514_g1_i1~~c17514_g1_i1.p1  ORF type:complete len:795 (-),score=254.57 c17514_g1_i1:254-2638(-)
MVDLSSPSWLNDFDTLALQQTYIHGFQPTQDDVLVLRALGVEPEPSRYPNAARYFRHLSAHNASQLASFPAPAKSRVKGTIKLATDAELCDGKTHFHAQPPAVPETMKKTIQAKQLASGFTAPAFDEYSKHRQELWDKLKAKQPKIPNHGEKVTVTDDKGHSFEAQVGVTRPLDIAKAWFGGDALTEFVVAKIDNKTLWDLGRPVEGAGEISFLRFDHSEAREVFWHSSSHVVGEALERVFGGNLTKGPPTEAGFFYDIFLGSKVVGEDDYKRIDDEVNKIIKEKQIFERILVSKQDGLELFKHNPFKIEIITNKVPDDAFMSVYKCGSLIDPCRGPHIINTGSVKACIVTKNSSAYWQGRAGQDSLQRVYGISFPSKDQMTEWKHLQEEAKKRDHRVLGMQQELYFFNELSPGSCFWLPHGTRIYNKLISTIKNEYWKRGFNEVVTPNMYSMKLWEISGHAAKYRENMFVFDVEDQEFALKPMNCPGHCLMFAHRVRSWRELPIRLADFGVLHRNELSGALHGLTRVRRFQQDDAHIFCMPDQIKDEITGALDFLNAVYGKFGFTYDVRLSTRPELYLGEVEVWNKAEEALKEALDASGLKWELNPGDGAFYGPKIDITLMDALKRKHQCGTIQLDFQLPIRFGLQFQSGEEEGKPVIKQPVIIHRAILGSVERFVSVLTEQCGGKWPFWLSPRQAIIVPIAAAFNDFSHQVEAQLRKEGYYVDTDLSNKSFNKKVRDGQLAQYNFILVIGEKEASSNGVSVRTRDNVVHGLKTVDELLKDWKVYADEHTNNV